VNSAAGSFGLSFGLAIAGGIMLWALALSFTHLTETSTEPHSLRADRFAEAARCQSSDRLVPLMRRKRCGS
jgi:hypothetical protein